MTVLPINNQVFRSDAARAFADAIAGTHHDYENWICDNYIGLRAAMDVFYQEQSLNIRTISPDVYGIPFIDCSRMARQTLLGIGAENWMALLKNALKNGFYVILNCNEFYLPQRGATRAYDYPHSEMIHGFDEANGTFLVYGFTQNRRFETVTADAADLIQSIETADCGMPAAFDASANQLIFARVNQTVSYSLNRSKIIQCIRHYVQSKNLLPELYWYFGSEANVYNPSLLEKMYQVYSKENFIYGLQCYDVAAAWFKSISNGEQPYAFPVNSLYALIEHKQCMQMRLQRFTDDFGAQAAELVRLYEENVVDAVRIVMNLLLKHEATQAPKHLLDVPARMHSIKEHEQSILNAFLRMVDRGTQNIQPDEIAKDRQNRVESL